MTLDWLIVGATLGVGGSLAALAYVSSPWLAGAVVFVTGACWLTVLSSLNTSAQAGRARLGPGPTLASFQLVMQGGLALGSLVLGLIAGGVGVRTASWWPPPDWPPECWGRGAGRSAIPRRPTCPLPAAGPIRSCRSSPRRRTGRCW